jgi:GT2 family glycosyltransferase
MSSGPKHTSGGGRPHDTTAMPAAGVAEGLQRARGVAASVVICCYTLTRLHQTDMAVRSVLEQVRSSDDVIVVVDHNPELLAVLTARHAGVTLVANTGARGLSGARNTGVAAARGEVIVFLDDDAVAQPGWLESVLEPFAWLDVMGVGGHVEPAWQGSRPRWFPDEFLWVVGCSYVGLPESGASLRNPIGANMGFRREVFAAVGGFAEGLGRVGTLPAGCEETELSLRATRALPGRRIVLHTPARVAHTVTADRERWSYFRRRCWSEGVSKRAVARVDRAGALQVERGYVARTLPRALLWCLRDLARGDGYAALRACAIVVGTGVTAVGYAIGVDVGGVS